MMGNKDYLSGGCDMGWLCSSPRETLLREIRQKKSENDYMIMPENFNEAFGARGGPACTPPPPPPPQKKKKKKKQIWILWQNSLTRELNIKVVGFVLKKILTYFEMLIVPHALHCVDSCIFVFTSFDTVCCFGFSAARPPPPFPNFFFYQI